MRAYAAAAAAAFGVLFAVPVALHLGFFWVEASRGVATTPDLGALLGSNALWALAWTVLGLLPLSYALHRRAPSAARSWAPVLALAGVAFVAACLRLALSSSGTTDLLWWAVPETVLVVLGFLAFEAAAAAQR